MRPVESSEAASRFSFRRKPCSPVRDRLVNEQQARRLRVSYSGLKRTVLMAPVIDKQKTGEQIRKFMNLRGFTVQDVKRHLSLGCVQSVYHWLDGQSAPSLDNLYALSELLRVPMDLLVCGNRSYQPEMNLPAGAKRLLRYYRLVYECMAA